MTVNTKQIKSRYSISIYLILYFVIRIFSFYFQPESIVNTIISILILITTIYLLLKKDERGWYIVAGEIILCGVGGFLSVGFVSLRTLLLICSLSFFFIYEIRDRRYEVFKKNKFISYLLSLIFITVIINVVNGLVSGNNLKLIYSDTVPYLFLLYYFPLRQLWFSTKFRRFAKNTIISAIIGNLIFILLTFAAFSSNLLVLGDNYYHWFREIVGGKITDMDNNFYRIVVNEHLLLVPLLLYYLFQAIHKKSLSISYLPRLSRWPRSVGQVSTISLSLLIILSINLTRIYILALLIGLIFLFSFKHWKRWLFYSIISILILISSFTAIHLIASRGQSLGWELFGLRIQSIAQPQIETSSLSRMQLLPIIFEKIRERPILEHGLGSEIRTPNAMKYDGSTTNQFDWGYLEIFAEMGIIGILIWISLISYLLSLIIKTQKYKNTPTLMLLTSILIINITSPALFHVMGIILLVILLNMLMNQKTALEDNYI